MEDKLVVWRNSDNQRRFTVKWNQQAKLACLISVACMAMLALVPNTKAAEAYGGAPGSYLRLGVGARAQALGGAFSAVADDPQAAFWNPAGLVQFSGINVYTQMAFFSYERKHSYFGYTHAVQEDLSLALSWLSYSGGDDLERRIGPSLEPLGYFSDRENCYMLSAGYQLRPQLSAGLTGKVLSHHLDEQFGWGFGFDLGLLYSYRGYRAALVLRDLGSRINWRNAYQEELPLTSCLGGSVKIVRGLLVAGEMSWTRGQPVRPHLGLEYELAKELALQCGYDRDEFSVGATVRGYTDWADYHFGYVLGNERMVGASVFQRMEFRMKFNAFDYYLWQ